MKASFANCQEQTRSGREPVLMLFFWAPLLFAVNCCLAATDSNSAEELPKLRPPKTELPPTLWEQHGTWIVASAATLLVLVAVVIWFLTRPRPAVPIPPEVKAREGLAKLSEQPETGRLLSEVSQIIRRYFLEAFSLPPQEFTTDEFSRLIQGHEEIGRELAQAIVQFLRQCDERKFSVAPDSDSQRSGVVEAIHLLDKSEARRAELRRLVTAQSASIASQRG